MFVVAGSDAAPVLEPVEGSFDDVAVLVVVGVEAQRSAAALAFRLATFDRVGLLRDDDPDAAGPQQFAVRSAAEGLDAAQRDRGRPRTTANLSRWL